MRTATLIAALTLASPAAASLDRLPVTQTSATDFAVGYKSRAGLNNYWCAAGRFVTNTLGLPASTRVYRLSPPPRKAGQGVSFTLDPARSAGATGLAGADDTADGGLTAGQAQAGQCNLNRSVGQ